MIHGSVQISDFQDQEHHAHDQTTDADEVVSPAMFGVPLDDLVVGKERLALVGDLPDMPLGSLRVLAPKNWSSSSKP